jgi:hypothetical protein
MADLQLVDGHSITSKTVKEADILLIHNSGEFLSWPENPEAFAIIFEAAGLDWDTVQRTIGYEATNYGVWYDDVQFARIALKQSEVARKLGVEKIVVAECGHAHKALIVIADRVLTGEANIRKIAFLMLGTPDQKKKAKRDPL